MSRPEHCGGVGGIEKSVHFREGEINGSGEEGWSKRNANYEIVSYFIPLAIL